MLRKMLLAPLKLREPLLLRNVARLAAPARLPCCSASLATLRLTAAYAKCPSPNSLSLFGSEHFASSAPRYVKCLVTNSG